MSSIKSLKPLGLAIILASALSACGGQTGQVDIGPKVDAETEVSVADSAPLSPLPTSASDLESYLIAAHERGDMDEFYRALDAYVITIDDRRRQRDFVNELWEGKNSIALNREAALPIAKRLADEYDISAPTYLVGFSYWAPTAGVEKDLGIVIDYWSRDNQSSNSAVQYRLANIFLDPEGGYYDPARGRARMQAASDGGNADAARWLAEN